MTATNNDRWLCKVIETEGLRQALNLTTPDNTPQAPPFSGDAPTGSIVEVALDDHGLAHQLKIWAHPGTAKAAICQLMGHHGVTPLFSPPVIAEAQAWLANPGLDDPSLHDLTHLPFVTIDNDHSRDLDQALLIEPITKVVEPATDTLPQSDATPGYAVYYALADAAHYVQPGSALFDAALQRGASIYMPGVTAPMLPTELSEGLISLNPQVPRRALVFHMRLDEAGQVIDTQILRARIFSRAKLTYKGVQALHDNPSTSPLHNLDFTPSLMLMAEVGRKRIALAEDRDVVRFDRVSTEIAYTDPQGTSFAAHLEQRCEVERWNEQLSLMCNSEGATFLDGADAHVQPVYRVHPAPEPLQINALITRLDAMINAANLDPNLWRWHRTPDGQGESLATYVDRLPDDPASIRLRRALERQIMMAFSTSSYTQTPGLHYGIGVQRYARFSAPMREIVGIFTHKEALEKLLGPSPHHNTTRDTSLRDLVIASGNRAKDLQRMLDRESHKMVMDQLMAADLQHPLPDRPIHTGTVMGISPTRLYVQLDDPPLEIKVYLDHLAQHDGAPPHLRPDRALLTRPNGQRISAGDVIHLRVLDYDPELHHWRLIPLEGNGTPP